MCLLPQIYKPKLGQIVYVGCVLKTSGPADFKSVTSFENWPRFVGVMEQKKYQTLSASNVQFINWIYPTTFGKYLMFWTALLNHPVVGDNHPCWENITVLRKYHPRFANLAQTLLFLARFTSLAQTLIFLASFVNLVQTLLFLARFANVCLHVGSGYVWI